MGRGPTTAANLQDYARLASERIRAARVSKPALRSLDLSARVSIPSKRRGMEESQGRLPLSEVVADCVKRWFQDTLKEARNGDTSMQVLVGQMYHSGYGIPRNEQKVRFFFGGSLDLLVFLGVMLDELGLGDVLMFGLRGNV